MDNDGKNGFLTRAYGLEGTNSTRSFYQEWATSYEQEVKANGYATPVRCAQAIADEVTDRSAPLLDLGCGTGLSGEALRAAGFTVIDGTDFSPEMLEIARGKSGVYRTLILGDLTTPVPAQPGEYVNMSAIGVFSPGHAPAALMDDVVSLLPSGGCFVFSLNDHALAEPAYEKKIGTLSHAGTVDVAFREYGAHLPGVGLKATVYVLRKR